MKIYGWMTQREGTPPTPHNRQVRCIVAAPSIAAARQAMAAVGIRWPGRDYISETGNAVELRIALTKPGTVFWLWDALCHLSDRGGVEWREWKESEL